MREAKLEIHERPDGFFYLSVPGLMRHDRKRKKLYFKTRKDAEAEVKKLKKLRRADGINARHIDQSLAIDATKAAKILRKWGKKLEEAAEHYAEYLEACSKSVTFEALWAEHMKNIEKKRERYVSNAKRFGEKLIPIIGDRMVNTITKLEIEAAMAEAGFTTPTMHNTAKAYIRPAFRLAVDNDWAKENVVSKVATKAVEPREIDVLSLAEVRMLLSAFKDFRKREEWRPELRVDCRDSIAPVVLMLFAGIRPEEIGRVQWKDLKLDHGVITVTSRASKKKRQRHIELEKNLLAWLELVPEAQREGFIAPSNWRRKWQAIRKAAGIEDRQDVLRHSYASYWLAAFENKDRLRMFMGHRDGDMIEEHYNAGVLKADALEFWKLVPEGTEAPDMLTLVG